MSDAGRTLVAAYGVAGGMPPATLENLRVYDDGTARAIVGNAWPRGTPQDEAGVYETTLDAGELDALRALADDPEMEGIPAELGELHADSGRMALELHGRTGSIVDVTWSPFARRPPALDRAEEHVRRLLHATRAHPVATVRLSLSPPARPVTAGAPVEVEFVARNTGSEPVRTSLFLPGWPAPRLAALAGTDPLPSTLPIGVHRSAPGVETLDAPDGDTLAPGTELRVRGRAAPELEPGWNQLIGSAAMTIELPGPDGPFTIDGFLATEPVEVEAEG